MNMSTPMGLYWHDKFPVNPKLGDTVYSSEFCAIFVFTPSHEWVCVYNTTENMKLNKKLVKFLKSINEGIGKELYFVEGGKNGQ